MFTLLTGLYKYYTQKEEFYVLVLGLDNAGKTTLLERIKTMYAGLPGLTPDKITPTVGLNIGRVELDRKTRVNFWDLGGQTDLQSIWESYYSDCHAIVFMIDSTDRDRLEECRAVFEKILMNQEVEGVPVIMLANKQDMPRSMKVEEIKEIFNKIAAHIGARDSNVLPVSALRGDGVREAVDWLFTRIQRNRAHRPPVFRN